MFSSEETNNIVNRFGERFFAKVQKDLETYAARWTLNDFQLVPSYSANLVFLCRSEKHGYAVLKFGSSIGEFLTEYHALREYNGRRMCRVLDADPENGILLEERVRPGTPLREEDSLDRRLSVFSSLYNGLHIAPADARVYKTYTDWVNRITDYMSKREDARTLYSHMKRAHELYVALTAVYSRTMLLHGDFHHGNILLDERGDYVIIDPKGVVGDPVFDVGRFILNEFENNLTPALHRKILDIIRTLSRLLHIPEDALKRGLYVETVMAMCWIAEDGASPDQIVRLVQIADFAEQLLHAS